MDNSVFTNPDTFTQAVLQHPDGLSLETAKQLDALDPLGQSAKLFNIGDLIPFAGHSLGPVFLPVLDKIKDIAEVQKKLHGGHAASTHPEGSDSGHWFDCDRHKPSLRAAQQVLGFEDDSEFIFTGSGLSQNLAMLVDTFYRTTQMDWERGKTKIVILDTEFFSDQAIVVSVLRRAIQTAEAFGCFKKAHKKPTPEDHILRIKADEKGLFDTDALIKVITEEAKSIQMICLSDIVFGTGQRLKLTKIFAVLKDVLAENQILVGLDLAHTVGNRKIDLKSLPLTFAVGCAYKHLSGFAGSGFGIYVNKNADLNKYPPLQGWKAADGSRVFPSINQYDDSIMYKKGALAFRASNPPPAALAPAQVFLQYFNAIGFDRCFNKSECLTRYLIAQLKQHLSDKIEWITPENPDERGAMIIFRVQGLMDVSCIEDFLRKERSDLGNYEIDVRWPNSIRVTPHYAYITFEHIYKMVSKLTIAIHTILNKQEKIKK